MFIIKRHCLYIIAILCSRPNSQIKIQNLLQIFGTFTVQIYIRHMSNLMLFRTELKDGIFARKAMVDQAHQGLCYQRETWHFGGLNIERITCSDLSWFVLRKLCYYFAPYKPHQKWLCYFVVLSHGKLDLSFFFMAGPKSVWICCTYRWPKSPRKMICHELWRNRFVYLQTHLLMQATATANKQLLSEVM